MQKNENCGVLKGIIIAHYLMPTWWVACDFSHAIASEFSDEACDCCTLLLFMCRSLHDMLNCFQLLLLQNYKSIKTQNNNGKKSLRKLLRFSFYPFLL